MIDPLAYQWRDVWPRRARGRALPPGQRLARAMPRFSARPQVPPPTMLASTEIAIGGDVATELSVDLERLERVEIVADFHCVTTWSVPELRWSGWRLRDVWEQLIVPDAGPASDASHLKVRGGDGYFAVLDLEDAVGDDVLIADRFEGALLDPVRGAPLRLVSPAQYGYKSVKHLNRITVHAGAPKRYGGAIEHPRARVALEERHERIGGRLLRWPYRALIIPTALMARRSARRDR